MLTVRSKFVAVIAVATGATLLIACYAVQTKPASAAPPAGVAKAATVAVRDTAEVQAALKSARGGDKILLAPGAYAALAIRNVKVAGGQAIIASADPSNPAIIAGIEISGSAGLTLRDLEVTMNARTQSVFNVVDSQDIQLERLDMHGATASSTRGLMFRKTTNVSVKNSKFHDLGTALVNIDSTRVTVSGNHFRQIRGDGVQTTGSSNVTIAGNHFTDFHTKPGDHPDAIQFFTLNQKASVKDIVITDNVVVRGSGDIIQGIFMGNEAKLPYVNVTITGNKIVGAMYNGIAIGIGENVTVTNNIVQAYADQDSWIMVQGSNNASVSNNSATAYVDKNNSRAKFKDNKKLRNVKVGDVSALESLPPPKGRR